MAALQVPVAGATSACYRDRCSVRPELVEGSDGWESQRGLHATNALCGRARPVTFLASPRKVTQRRRPQAIRCFPAVLASGGRRRNRPTRGTRYARPRQWTHAAPLGPPAAALLGANPWGPCRTDA